MAGMICAARRISALRISDALPRSAAAAAAAFGQPNRSLCSDGARYVQPGTYVEGTPEAGEPWAPPTQGGFVPESYPPQQQQQQQQDPYVPVTQGGFVEDYRAAPAAAPDYNPGYQQWVKSPYYVQYPPPHLPPPPPQLPYPPPPPPPPPPQVQGQFIPDGNPWYHAAAPQAPYGTPAYGQPMHDHAAYVYQQQQQQQYAAPAYTPPPPPSYEQSYQQQPGPSPLFDAALYPPPLTGYDSYRMLNRTWSHGHAQVSETPYGGESPTMAEPEVVAAAETARQVEESVETEGKSDPPVAERSDSEPVAAQAAQPEVPEVPELTEVPEVTELPEQPEQPEDYKAAAPVSGSSAEETAAAAAGDGDGDDNAAEEQAEEYDATAAAMAELGLSSDGAEEESEEKAEAAAESQAEEEEEPVKGPLSLLDVETSKAKPAPPPQSESFLEILSKTNLNRPSRPRLAQPSFRSQRSNTGKTYARLYNLPRQILKSDLVNYFSELNLLKENIHITYDEKFYPISAQIGFDSAEALRDAHKILQTKGRFGGRIVRWEQFIAFNPPGHPQITESMKNYLGRMLVMLHLPPEGRSEDVERFFENYGYDPSAVSLLEPINMTLARFPKEGNRLVRRAAIGFFSSMEAMRALRERQGDFVLNEPVELRLIQ